MQVALTVVDVVGLALGVALMVAERPSASSDDQDRGRTLGMIWLLVGAVGFAEQDAIRGGRTEFFWFAIVVVVSAASVAGRGTVATLRALRKRR